MLDDGPRRAAADVGVRDEQADVHRAGGERTSSRRPARRSTGDAPSAAPPPRRRACRFSALAAATAAHARRPRPVRGRAKRPAVPLLDRQGHLRGRRRHDRRRHRRRRQGRSSTSASPASTRWSSRATASTRTRRRGSCNGLEATAFVEDQISRAKRVVRLAAQNPTSKTGHRIRRSVAVRIDGQWRTSAACWWRRATRSGSPTPPSGRTTTSTTSSSRRPRPRATTSGTPPTAARPRRRRRCASASTGTPTVTDEKNLNGEWIDISNPGPVAVPLAGWWVRDSWLIYNARHVPGFEFPSYATIPAGGSVRVYVGCGEDGPDRPTRFHWCQDDGGLRERGDRRPPATAPTSSTRTATSAPSRPTPAVAVARPARRARPASRHPDRPGSRSRSRTPAREPLASTATCSSSTSRVCATSSSSATRWRRQSSRRARALQCSPDGSPRTTAAW